jgi:3-deoxy-D-manno-octulosonic-acid transferase
VPWILGTRWAIRSVYSLATVIFVGRLLCDGRPSHDGGGRPRQASIFGPHTFNFRQTVEVLLQGQGALQVSDKDGLQKAMEKCLSDPAYSGKIAQAGQAVIRENQGATARTMEVLRSVLKA